MDDQKKTESILHNFEENKSSSIFSLTLVFVLLLIATAGIGTGYLLAKSRTGGSLVSLDGKSNNSSIDKGKTFGSNDLKTFKDSAEGVLKKGGIEDEGQYHLVRPGGDTQNVYLTSSALDLSLFTERKIKVWGETQKAQRAGWLMDVGRVEILE